jgi:hypothetical protein
MIRVPAARNSQGLSMPALAAIADGSANIPAPIIPFRTRSVPPNNPIPRINWPFRPAAGLFKSYTPNVLQKREGRLQDHRNRPSGSNEAKYLAFYSKE